MADQDTNILLLSRCVGLQKTDRGSKTKKTIFSSHLLFRKQVGEDHKGKAGPHGH